MIALFLILVVVGGYMVYNHLIDSINPYLTVSELHNTPEKYYGRTIQVTGISNVGSIERAGEYITLTISDVSSSVEVIYSGVLPSGFQEGNSVVVIGIFKSDGSIEADKILVKCPSKYEEAEKTSLIND